MSGKRVGWIVLSGSALAVVVVQISTLLVVTRLLPAWSERGQLGDVFGITNSFFSGVAYFGLIYTIILQQQQMSLERNARVEIQDARVEDTAIRAYERNLDLLRFLISYYDDESNRLMWARASGGPIGAEQASRLAELRERRSQCQKVIDDMHTDVISGLRS